MAKTIATVSGVALAPGVSRNGRHYSKEAIGRAVTRAQERIDGGKRPIAMYTDHESVKTTDIVGAVSKIWQEADGSAHYIADIADTQAGRTIAALINPAGNGPQFLRGVSIRGNWVGRTRKERGPSGTLVETGDDLEIGRLDWVSEPGVELAGVDAFRAAAKDGESAGEYGISESAPEALVTTITEEAVSPLQEDAPPVPVAEAVPEGIREALSGIFGAERHHVFENGLCRTCRA